jgi:hypothetical protein
MASKEQLKMQEAINAAAKEYNLTLDTQKALLDDVAKGHIQSKGELQESLNIMRQMEQEQKKAEIHARLSAEHAKKSASLHEQIQDLAGQLNGDVAANLKLYTKVGDQMNDLVANYTKSIQAQVKLGKLTKAEGKQLIKNVQELQEMANHVQTLAQSKLTEPFEKMGKAAGDALEDMIGQLEVFDGVLKGLSVGGMVGVLVGIVALFTEAVGAAFELSEQANEVADNTGMSYIQAERLTSATQDAVSEGQLLASTFEDVLAVQQSMTNELGIMISVTPEVAGATSEIASAFGITNEMAGAVNANLIKMGVPMENAAAMQADIAKEAMMAGVSIEGVMEDISKQTETTSKFFGNNVKALAKASIEARKLGVELDTMGNMADTLLDFETSIQKQFEFQALTGKTLNLDRARQLALEGDIVGASKEALKNFGSAAEFSEMDHMSKTAAAEAMGMTVTELQNALNTEEARKELAGKLSADQMKMAEDLGLSVEELNKLEGQALVDKINQANEQKNLNADMSALMMDMQKILVPAGQKFLQIFTSIKPVLSTIVGVIGTIVSTIAEGVAGMFDMVKNSRTLQGILIAIGGLYLGIKGYVMATNALKMIQIGYDTTLKALGLTNLGQLFTMQGLQTAINTLKATENMTMLKGAGIMVASMAKAAALGAVKLASAVGGIFTSLSAIPIAGPALAAVAVAGMMALFARAKAKKAGDLSMSAGGGPVVMSPREGTIFQGTKNDELAMGPGVIGAATTDAGTAAVTTAGPDMGAVVAAINELKAVITQMPPPVIKMDSNIVSETVYATNSYKKR